VKKIVFLHIPKTGGSTFNNILQKIGNQKNYNFLQTGFKGYLPNFSFNYFNVQPKNKLFSGHFVFSDECKNVDLYTLVRDVHKTFFSNLYFKYFYTYIEKKRNLDNIKRIKNNISFEFTLSELDIPIIINLLRNNFITSNTFTKTIAGIPYEKYFFVEKDYKITKADFEIAINNLKYFKLIGDLNSFKIFLEKFFSFYDFKLESYTIKNKGNYDRDFIDLMIQKLNQQIIDYNYYDYLLIKEIRKNL